MNLKTTRKSGLTVFATPELLAFDLLGRSHFWATKCTSYSFMAIAMQFRSPSFVSLMFCAPSLALIVSVRYYSAFF
jgi:hypothetical protein